VFVVEFPSNCCKKQAQNKEFLVATTEDARARHQKEKEIAATTATLKTKHKNKTAQETQCKLWLFFSHRSIDTNLLN
jgi:hypothetical protein